MFPKSFLIVVKTRELLSITWKRHALAVDLLFVCNIIDPFVGNSDVHIQDSRTVGAVNIEFRARIRRSKKESMETTPPPRLEERRKNTTRIVGMK